VKGTIPPEIEEKEKSITRNAGESERERRGNTTWKREQGYLFQAPDAIITGKGKQNSHTKVASRGLPVENNLSPGTKGVLLENHSLSCGKEESPRPEQQGTWSDSHYHPKGKNNLLTTQRSTLF